MKRPARAYFTSREEARKGALAINDHFKTTLAFYRREGSNSWAVEAPGMDYADFVKRLAAAGCEGTVTPPGTWRNP